MKLNSLLVLLLALFTFGSGASYAAELDVNPSQRTLDTFKPSQDAPIGIQSKTAVSYNSGLLARLIARAIVPIEIGIWSANNAFLIGLSGTTALLVKHDPSFHVWSRQADIEKFLRSMQDPLLSSKSDIEFDVQESILNMKLDYKQMEGAI